jgi:hypothetical protein
VPAIHIVIRFVEELRESYANVEALRIIPMIIKQMDTEVA